MAALNPDRTLDFCSANDQSNVEIHFVDGDDFPLINIMEQRASEEEFYCDESQSSEQDSSEDSADESTQEGGGRKGGPKTAKLHRNTPKNRKPHRIFSRIPKPRVHVGRNMKADVSKTCDIF